jgi:hypothetical protein
MRSARFAVVAVVLMALAMAAAQAQAPTVTFPRNGDRIGPATDVIGNLGHRGLIVIITDVYNAGDEATPHSVPGIRHYTEADGSFSFHVALPRHQRGQTGPLVHKICVFELRGPNNPGPETVVTVHPND